MGNDNKSHEIRRSRYPKSGNKNEKRLIPSNEKEKRLISGNGNENLSAIGLMPGNKNEKRLIPGNEDEISDKSFFSIFDILLYFIFLYFYFLFFVQTKFEKHKI